MGQRTRFALAWAALGVIGMGGAGMGVPVMAANPADFEVFNYSLRNNATPSLPGRIYLPEDYQTHSYPIVLFLHGSGESGNNNESQVNGNIDNLLAKAKSEGFILYAPQAPSSSTGWGSAWTNQAMSQVAQATMQFNADPSRIYVTGLSMGGSGTYMTMLQYGDVAAAAVPIAGGTPAGAANDKHLLIDRPIWGFIAKDDEAHRVNAMRDRMNDVLALEGKPKVTFPTSSGGPYYSPTGNGGATYFESGDLRYTEYNSGGHNSWSRTYADQNMYDWMLSHDNPIDGIKLGDTVLFDLGINAMTSVDGLGRMWNSTPNGTQATNGIAVPFAYTAEGERTTVHLEVTKTFSGDGAQTSLITSDALPTTILGDAWSAASYHSAGEVVLHGLDPNLLYDIDLFGSTTVTSGTHTSRYIIDGITQDLDLIGNVDTTAHFSQMIPGLDGTITISMGNAISGGGSNDAYTSWFSITAVPEPGTLAGVFIGALGLLARRRRERC